MPFQFLCPQGHLLHGDEAHMGMQTHCPQCGVLFIIPTVPVAQAPGMNEAQTSAGDADAEGLWPGSLPGSAASPKDYLRSLGGRSADEQTQPGGRHGDETDATTVSKAAPTDEVEPKIEAQPSVLHIPCPNGHELESPLDMLGQEVLCPHCSAQFLLRREDSLEARQEEELREQRRAEAWLRWSIAAAVIVLAGLLAMIFIAHS